MNKERRKRLAEVSENIEDIMAILEEIQGEEEESYENLPESFQEGKKGEEMQEYIDKLSEVYYYMDDVKSTLDDIVNS